MYSANYSDELRAPPGALHARGGGGGGVAADDVAKRVKDPILKTVDWAKNRPPKEKAMLAGGAAVLLLGLLWLVVEDHDNLFVMAETVHFLGIAVLAYKLVRKRNSGGLSLQSQYLTAAFLATRLACSFMMEYDIHTALDFATLAATGWVVWQLTGPCAGTFQAEQDSLAWYWVAAPCLLVALFAHPGTHHPLPFRVAWAACVYMEAVSVLPQLRAMQKAKVVEKFTAHYVAALGLSRFISCAHWLLQIMDGRSFLLQAIGSGLWPVMVLLSEVVQTFILADFCFYYLKSYVEGTGVVHLAAGIV